MQLPHSLAGDDELANVWSLDPMYSRKKKGSANSIVDVQGTRYERRQRFGQNLQYRRSTTSGYGDAEGRGNANRRVSSFLLGCFKRPQPYIEYPTKHPIVRLATRCDHVQLLSR
jgi:hypothetical protein